MDDIYLEENILCIENFLSKSEIDSIMFECVLAKEGEWWELDKHNEFNGKTKSIKSESVLNIVKSIYSRVNVILNYPKYELDSRFQLNRYFPEDIEYCLGEHYDSATNNIYKGGVVIYLNDNFEGGSLEYVNKNISIQPKAGMLVVHPGDQEYSHRINQIKSGYRYSLIGLIKGQSEESDQYTYLDHIV